jgi:drug/metabolite transporter (DMT)-like permease
MDELNLLLLLGLAYIAVLFTAISQILLKIGAKSAKNKRLITLYLNRFTVVGYVILFGVTIINLYVYKFLDLKYSLTILPFTFILVGIFSYFLFNEKFTKNKLIGSIIVIIGVIIFNIH